MRLTTILLTVLWTVPAIAAETRSQCTARLDKQIAAIDARMRSGHYGSGNALREQRRKLTDTRYNCRKLPPP